MVGTTGTIAATSSSGLPVTVTATPSSVCTLNNGVLTSVAVGQCLLQGSVDGNTNWLPTISTMGIQIISLAPTLGTTLVGSAAGTSSLVLPTNGAWTASSNASFLHIGAGSESGTSSAVIVFNYDAFTTTGTRTGTLTIAGQTVTITQVGTNYTQASGFTTLLNSGLAEPSKSSTDAAGNVYIADNSANAILKYSPATGQTTTLVANGVNGVTISHPHGTSLDAAGNVYFVIGNTSIAQWNPSTQQLTTLITGIGFTYWVYADASGNIYYPDLGQNLTQVWSPVTQQLTTISPWVSGVIADGLGSIDEDSGFGNPGAFLKVQPRAWVPTTPVSKPGGAGSDSIAVLPSGIALGGALAPTSDSNWLTISGASDGVVSFRSRRTRVSRAPGRSPFLEFKFP